jgi:hypothetical protein
MRVAGNAPEWIDLARRAQRSDAPHRELVELKARIRGAATPGVHAAAVDRMLAAAADFAREQSWAAEMQLGAEGFDNTTSARAYRDVQACLVEAGRNLARACEILLAQD